VEKHAIASLLRASRGESVVLLVTFLLVVFRDLIEGILVGFGLGALLFLHRMAQSVGIETVRPMVEQDQADAQQGNGRTPYDVGVATDRDVIVYRISGAFFFGAAAAIGTVLDRIAEHPRAYVIDVSGVPLLDSTAAATIEAFARKARRHGAAVYIAGAARPIRRMLLTQGVRPPHVRYRTSVTDALASAHARPAAEPAEQPV
jgi:SulP family sulfate permease